MDIDLGICLGSRHMKNHWLYRSPMWHAEYDFNKRSPYASLQIVLDACLNVIFVINLINRDNSDEVVLHPNIAI